MPRVDGFDIDLSHLLRAERRRIGRACGRSGATLAKLGRKLSPDDLELVRNLVDQARAAKVVALSTPDGRPRKTDGRGWLKWLKKNGPAGIEKRGIFELFGRFGARNMGLWRDEPLQSFLTGPHFHNAADEFVDWLEEAEVDWEAARVFARQAERWRAEPPTNPTLREYWDILRLHDQQLRKSGLSSTLTHTHHGLVRLVEDPSIKLMVQGIGELRTGDAAKLVSHHGKTGLLDLVHILLDAITRFADTTPIARFAVLMSMPLHEAQLERLLDETRPVELEATEDKRLLGWLLTNSSGSLSLDAVQCRAAKRGGTYVLRKATRLSDQHELLSEPRDREIHRFTSGWLGSTIVQALRLLVGHPRVFWSGHSKKVPVQVHEATVGLGVRRERSGAVVRIELDGAPPEASIEVSTSQDIAVAAVGDRKVVFAALATPTRRALNRFKAHGPIQLPDADAIGALLRMLPALARTLAIDVDATLLGRPLDPDPRPLLACRWDNGTLDLEAKVAPLPDSPPLTPGHGSPMVFVERSGELHHVQRDLDTEATAVQQRLAPLGLPDTAQTRPFAWTLPDPQAALSVVEAIQAHRAQVQLRWQGDPPKPPGTVNAKGLRIKVGSGIDWFGVDGELKSGRTRITLKAAMAAAAEGHAYVPVGKDTWTRLEDGLRQRLADLHTVSENGRLGALHASVLETLEEAGATLDAPEVWRQRRAAAAAARSLQVPLPDGLQATLRPYQEEGFLWLARLASWAPGAVLADDMGLGKTLQTIALLLHRAEQGPALVVAPTSVVDNWRHELTRFAPGLTVGVYRGDKRADLLEAPPAVLLTSYGLMTRDIDALKEQTWGTVVLDEAQAIRNPTAQRSQAARSLDAGFRLALSGTPVQNRTSELWAVMAFALPGLLGSRTGFQSRFIVPIEHHRDTDRRDLLARLIAPFVLRRTKQAVLTELPPRTETLVRVQPTPEERAAYQQARANALERLDRAGRQKSFKVLQELLRLRQLACHPKLVDPTSAVPSSKLRSVVRTLVQLKAAGHKALVFSSFTSHLALVREALEERGFVLRYLDGSTSVRRRADEVAAFQAGDGDAFLISLKAGGTGLNLTAASYVLHLDPWWNPAAEDQASDRAHRMGQDKAVTVYRFVSAGTVEEQIVALHAHKRELAEALLSASGTTQQLNTDELVALIQAAHDPDAAPALPPPPPAPRPVLRLVPPPEDPVGAQPVVSEPVPVPEPAIPPVPEEMVVPGAAATGQASGAGVIQALLDDFEGYLDEELLSGRLKRDATARTYLRTLRNVFEWCVQQGHETRAAVVEHADGYVAVAKAGGGLAKSDKHYVGTTLRRWRASMEE